MLNFGGVLWGLLSKPCNVSGKIIKQNTWKASRFPQKMRCLGRTKHIPGSSRYVKFLRFGRFFGWKGTHFTRLEDPGMCMIIVLHAYSYNISAPLVLILLLKPLKQIIDIPQEHPQFAKMQEKLVVFFWFCEPTETIKQVKSNVSLLAFFSCGLSIQIPLSC